MFMYQLHARCQSCDYGLEFESVSRSSLTSKIGTALAEHAWEFPTHVLNLASSRPDCTLEQHLDATSTATPCKCQVG